jgi:hypothetical protein
LSEAAALEEATLAVAAAVALEDAAELDAATELQNTQTSRRQVCYTIFPIIMRLEPGLYPNIREILNKDHPF